MHLFTKIGWAMHKAATSLKMVKKGLDKEDLAIAVLIDFPFQILSGYLVVCWSHGEHPLHLWIWVFWPRLMFALIGAIIVLQFPKPPISNAFFVLLVIQTLLGSFSTWVNL